MSVTINAAAAPTATATAIGAEALVGKEVLAKFASTLSWGMENGWVGNIQFQSQQVGVEAAFDALSRPSRAGWKMRRRAALAAAMVEAMYASGLELGAFIAARLEIEDAANAAKDYAKAYAGYRAKNFFALGSEAGARMAGEAMIRVHQRAQWNRKASLGLPLVKNGEALMGLAVAWTAWMELSPHLQARVLERMGWGLRPAALEDVRALVGGKRLEGRIPSVRDAVEVMNLLANGVAQFQEELRDEQLKGYGLTDVNPLFFNCGHYPEWVVSIGGKYSSQAEAREDAAKKNAASHAAWAAYLA